MRTLMLLRHAKSDWGAGGDDRALPDAQRPLNAKGRRAAATMGRWLRAEGVAFDHVVASPAVRVAETIDALAQGYGRRLVATVDRRLYLAALDTLLDVVADLPAGAGRVLLVGHDPGLADLVLALVPAGDDDAGRRAVAEKYPTASLAELTIDGDWAGAAAGATLTRFVRPRDLNPALGPDEA